MDNDDPNQTDTSRFATSTKQEMHCTKRIAHVQHTPPNTVHHQSHDQQPARSSLLLLLLLQTHQLLTTAFAAHTESAQPKAHCLEFCN
jgi:hypothetical protein